MRGRFEFGQEVPLQLLSPPPAVTPVALPLERTKTVGLISTVTMKLFVRTVSAAPGKTVEAT